MPKLPVWRNIEISADKSLACLCVDGPLVNADYKQSGDQTTGSHSYSSCLWQLLWLFTHGRYQALLQGFLDYPTLASCNCDLFTSNMSSWLEPGLWESELHGNLQYKVMVQLESVGRTSFVVTSRLIDSPCWDTCRERVLSTSRLVLVSVDKASGQAVPRRWSPTQTAPSPGSLRNPAQFLAGVNEIPLTASCCEVTVTSEDTYEGHTNESAYVRYCLQTQDSSIVDSRSRRFLTNPVKELHVQYVGKSFVGDRLKVFSWQPEDHRDAAYHVVKVQKKNKDFIIFMAVLVYFDCFPLPTPRL